MGERLARQAGLVELLAHPNNAVQEPAIKSLVALLNLKKLTPTTVETTEPMATIEGDAGLLSAAALVIPAPYLTAATATSTSAEVAADYAHKKQFVADISLATAIVPVADWHELLFLTRHILLPEPRQYSADQSRFRAITA